jgi:hypothetical protein
MHRRPKSCRGTDTVCDRCYVAENRILDLRDFQPRAHAEVAQYFQQALAKESRKRPLNAKSVQRRLERLMATIA